QPAQHHAKQRFSAERKVHGGFAIALACLVIIGALSYISRARSIENVRWVEHTQDVLGGLETLIALLTDAETAARGYVITGDETYLAPYRLSRETLGETQSRLTFQTADNALQQQRLRTVSKLVAERLEQLRTVIDLRRAEGFEAARAEIQRG